jgi:membrane protease YdiL (CAAX protease family)
MKKVSKQLTLVYVLLVAVALVMVALYEFGVLESGVLADSKQTEFVAMTVMELTTLVAAFLGLRLFKFPKIHAELVTRKEPAMLKWGMLRLLVLEVPMVVNTYLYYMYMNPTFGYLAIILLLCLPFVMPTENRCIDETTEQEEVNPEK